MRRAAALCAAILIVVIMYISPGASAASAAPAFDLQATVAPDSSARIALRMTIHLDTPQESLSFPVPASAYDIQVNGITPATSRRGQVIEVDLTRIVGAVAGDISVSITYSLPSVVEYNEDDQLILTLPILCGFTWPIERSTFTVTLPDQVPGRATVASTYYSTRIQENLTLTNQGNQIVGQLDQRLLGSDWLTLTLAVSEEMFPQQRPIVWVMDGMDLSMIVTVLLALAYWFLFLRCLPPKAILRSTAPDGVTAGDVGPVLTMRPTDLSLLVVQWAQLGYIIIQLDDHGRVLLHKRMNMGNERSQYEGRIFRSLFGAKTIIDGTGSHYALLCRKVATGKPGIHGIFQPGSGNPGLFRILVTLTALFAGISHGAALGAASPYQGVLMVLFGILCPLAAWVIQEGCGVIHLRERTGLWISLGLALGWMAMGFWVGEPIVASLVVLWQLLAGLAAAYGGRRTEQGKQVMEQLLGLRRWCVTASHEELVRILKVNPDYFYTLAPYALAMGVEQELARRFGGVRMSARPYLTTGMDGHMTAMEWTRHLRSAVDALDRRQKQLAWQRFLRR